MGYWRAVARYALARGSVGASDEHRLLSSLDLPPAPGAHPLPRRLEPLSDEWQSRLTATKTRAFRVVRDGVLTHAWDAPGDAPNRPGRLYSITKSVLSLAWGAADAEGLVPGLDSPLHLGLTARQLLRMDSGLGFDEGFSTLNRQVLTYLHPDARRTARRGRLVDPVGQDFHYNDFHSLLLGVVLEESLARAGWRPSGPVQQPLAAWIWEKVLVPLGLEHAGRFVVDSPRSGFPKVESGLCLAADDVARLGLAVLAGGPWIDAATAPENGWSGAKAFGRYRDLAWGPWLATGRGFYGWHWWGRHEPVGRPSVFALGIHGQMVVVSRRHRAVVVRLADRWALQEWWPDLLLDALEPQVLPNAQSLAFS